MSVEFSRPATLPQALQTLADAGEQAKILAGGTALSLMLRNRLVQPRLLINLDAVPELKGVHRSNQGWHIGAMTLLREIERSASIKESHPALAAACAEVGNVRVRNQATLGGNLAEADYASDPPTALVALNAFIHAVCLAGARIIPIAEFFQGFYTTALQPDEILYEVIVPPLPTSCRSAFLKYRSRSSEDRPCVVVAAVADIQNGACEDLRVVVGAACEVPTRVPEAEAMAHGEPLTDGRISQIAEAYAEGVETLEDLRGSSWYRSQMIRVFVARALREVRTDGR